MANEKLNEAGSSFYNKIQKNEQEEQEKLFEKILEKAEAITVQVGKSADESKKMKIAFDGIDASTRNFVKKMQEAGLSEKQQEKLIETRLQNLYKYADENKKQAMQQAAMQAERDAAEKKYQEALIAFENARTKKQRDNAQKKLQESQEELQKQEELYAKQKKYEEELSNYREKTYDQYLKDKQNKDRLDAKKKAAFEAEMAASAEGATSEQKEEAKRLRAEAKEEEKRQKQEEIRLQNKQALDLKENLKNLGASVITAIGKLGDTLDKAVDNAVNVVSTYRAKVEYRLEGIDTGWKDIYKLTEKNLGTSALVKQQAVLERIGKAIDEGIAYNVEQRAFLAEVSDKIQSTFDAFDSNLLRLIRIQSADSTAARLGMEKALNDMLTNWYKDSSYLNTAFDQVSQALFEMTGMQGSRQAVETEYVVQKWLGSLYSVGASQNAIQQIAQGIGYLGSGNVSALSGNQSLQTLLALSASRAGLDYAGLLTGGLSARDLNELLGSMVKYLAEIADSTSENKVVTSAFGNIFGLSISDLKAFANLSSSYGDVYGSAMDYSGAYGTTTSALGKLSKNLGTAQMMQNVMDNAVFNTGMFYSNGPMYALYKAVDLLDKLTNGGPEIKIQPWGVGTSFKVFDIIKSGMFGVGLMSSLISSGANVLGGTNLSDWGGEDVVTRGSGMSLKTTGGESFSATRGSASSQDVQEQSLKEGMEQSDQIQSATGATEKDMYEALVKEGDKQLVSNIKLRTDSMDKSIVDATKLLDEISNNTSKKSFNVNIQRINGKDLTGDSLKTTPDDAWEKLLMAASVLIKYGTVVNGFGGGIVQNITADQKEEDGNTLQDFLDLFIPMLETSVGRGLPVRLESMDTLTNLYSDLRK